jgi:hypothetical protein
MGDYARDGLELEDEDRLPWLEPADSDTSSDGLSTLKLLLFILISLVVIGALVAGIWYVKNREAGASGEGVLIAAPKGDYKVAANETDAKTFQGEGDASFPVSEGVDRDGHIDPSRLPEVPVTAGAAPADATKAAVKSANKVSAPVGDATKAPVAKVAPVAPVTSKGPMIQLGAYGSEAVALDAWKKLSKRFDYLAPLGTSVEKATVGATTVYRLRASVGSNADAGIMCGKLKVAGENCLVVR